MYILINKNTNKVEFIRDKKPISYSENLILTEVETLPEKYDYLIAENIMEVTDKWTEIQEDYDANGEIVSKEVERERTYLTCDLVAKFKPQPTAEQLERQKRQQYEKLCKQYIRQEYDLEEELGIQRERDEEPEKFTEYNNKVKECKAKAHKEVYGE